MKNRMLKSLSLLCIPFMMAASVMAQTPSKMKEKDKNKEDKYRTEYVKEKGDKEKVKGRIHPMHRTMVQQTDMKTGQTQVKTKENIESFQEPILPEVTPVEPTASKEVSVNPTPALAPLPEKKVAVHKRMAPRATYHRAVASRKPAVRYITRTKVVNDTVYVPSEPVVKTNTEYIHDTVEMTRVDTVTRFQTQNTYTGYNVPRGNFKKVKLRKDKYDDGVHMKRKGER